MLRGRKIRELPDIFSPTAASECRGHPSAVRDPVRPAGAGFPGIQNEGRRRKYRGVVANCLVSCAARFGRSEVVAPLISLSN